MTDNVQDLRSALDELKEALESVDIEEGCTIFNHTPEEIGLMVMENRAAMLAALAQPAENAKGGEVEPSDITIAAKAREALGLWLAWPDGPRDGIRPVTNEQVESWLAGLPNRLGYPPATQPPGDEPVGMREENERLDNCETELMGQLSGLDQMNIILADLVRRAMRLIPEGKSLWWDQAKGALDMVDEAARLTKNSQPDTVSFVQEWMMSGDHEADQWHKDFAAAIDARQALATPARTDDAGRPAHDDDCEAMQRPRADCTCCPAPASDRGEVDVLPCDVKLPPATTIRAGCSFDTLRLALNMEGRPRHFEDRKSGAFDLRATIDLARKMDADDGGYPPPPPAGEAVQMALRSIREWVASLTVTDMNEIVADGGITAGMVVGQEAVEQLRRLDAALQSGEGKA